MPLGKAKGLRQGTDEHSRMRASRVAASLASGLLVGLGVASLVGVPHLVGAASIPALISNAFTFWGLLFGGFAAVVAAGLTFAILNRNRRRVAFVGRAVAGVALAVFAAATISLIATWGFSPFTLEGMWIYPLAIATTIGAIVLLRPRRSPGIWDEPEGS